MVSWGVSIAVDFECVADTYLPVSECKPKAKQLLPQSKTKENRLVSEHGYSKVFSKGKKATKDKALRKGT